MLIRLDTLEPWKGEVLNGLKHPLNIETVWTSEELKVIGLALAKPFVAPEGRKEVGPPSFKKNLDGSIQTLYSTELIPEVIEYVDPVLERLEIIEARLLQLEKSKEPVSDPGVR